LDSWLVVLALFLFLYLLILVFSLFFPLYILEAYFLLFSPVHDELDFDKVLSRRCQKHALDAGEKKKEVSPWSASESSYLCGCVRYGVDCCWNIRSETCKDN